MNACSLVRIGDLDFDFYSGSCGSFNIPVDEAAVEEVVLLCFSYNTFTNTDERKKCRTYNGKDIKELNTKSKYEHTYAGVNLGKYKNRPFVVGGFDTRGTIPDIGLHGKAESLELGLEVDNGWKLEATYPFHIR